MVLFVVPFCTTSDGRTWSIVRLLFCHCSRHLVGKLFHPSEPCLFLLWNQVDETDYFSVKRFWDLSVKNAMEVLLVLLDVRYCNLLRILRYYIHLRICVFLSSSFSLVWRCRDMFDSQLVYTLRKIVSLVEVLIPESLGGRSTEESRGRFCSSVGWNYICSS